jgi:uncharacterized protein (DUF2267 family)
MVVTGLHTFDLSLLKTKEWLEEIREELNYEDQERAFTAMRAVLHALRDRLSIEQAVNLSAQLPMMLSGVFFEGWSPSGKPLKIRTKEKFLFRVNEELRDDMDAESAVRAVFKMLSRHISEGEIESIKSNLPEHIVDLW